MEESHAAVIVEGTRSKNFSANFGFEKSREKKYIQVNRKEHIKK